MRLAGVMADTVGTLEAAGIDPTARAEDLGPDVYIRLAEVTYAS